MIGNREVRVIVDTLDLILRTRDLTAEVPRSTDLGAALGGRPVRENGGTFISCGIRTATVWRYLLTPTERGHNKARPYGGPCQLAGPPDEDSE